ncbi:hypothetical protein [Palaeococcus ferrophilus]|uniref:hypothetical protein n=1 Tax=Palaeococcus ferrophilus TaxID=83868 RepID=UPI00064F6E6E|nr:hypothetical protein [Palaeococcus ferrophilus]
MEILNIIFSFINYLASFIAFIVWGIIGAVSFVVSLLSSRAFITYIPHPVVELIGPLAMLWVGAEVEEYYTPRPVIFLNAIAINLHFLALGWDSMWVRLYMNLGLIFGGLAWWSYEEEFSMHSTFYDWAKLLYGTGTCGLVILMTWVWEHLFSAIP